MFQTRQIEAVFIHATEGILITNQNGTIILANPYLLNQFGYSESELIGMSVDTLVPLDRRSGHAAYRTAFAERPMNRSMGKDTDLALFGQRKDGSQFPVEVGLSSYETDEGIFMVAFVIDITERKQHQDYLKRANLELEQKVEERTTSLQTTLAELERSREELNRALVAEQDLNEIKSRFVSTASHEFRTPLSAILSSVSLIGKYTTTDEQDKRDRHIHRIKSAINSLTDILNDFLSIGKLEEGKIIAHRVHCNLSELTNELVKEIGMIAKPNQRLSCQCHMAADVFIDPNLFKNILNNLLSNAIKYSPDDGKIELVIRPENGRMVVTVTDNGIGIPVPDQPHLFERFFRGRNALNIQGTGLGLNIVAKYVELLGGTISYQSTADVGSTFTVSLPLQAYEETHPVD